MKMHALVHWRDGWCDWREDGNRRYENLDQFDYNRTQPPLPYASARPREAVAAPVLERLRAAGIGCAWAAPALPVPILFDATHRVVILDPAAQDDDLDSAVDWVLERAQQEP
jgi:hypothetical protein